MTRRLLLLFILIFTLSGCSDVNTDDEKKIPPMIDGDIEISFSEEDASGEASYDIRIDINELNDAVVKNVYYQISEDDFTSDEWLNADTCLLLCDYHVEIKGVQDGTYFLHTKVVTDGNEYLFSKGPYVISSNKTVEITLSKNEGASRKEYKVEIDLKTTDINNIERVLYQLNDSKEYADGVWIETEDCLLLCDNHLTIKDVPSDTYYLHIKVEADGESFYHVSSGTFDIASSDSEDCSNVVSEYCSTKEHVIELYVKEQSSISYISDGIDDNVILTDKGVLIGWGNNLYDNYIVGEHDFFIQPQEGSYQFADMENVVEFQHGDHSGILYNDGRLYLWGYNRYGQIGNGEYGVSNTVTEPFIVSEELNLNDDDKVKTFALGDEITYILSKSGKLFVMGNTMHHDHVFDIHFLDAEEPQDITSKIPLIENEVIVDVYTLSETIFIKTSNNRIISWGRNYEGQACYGDNKSIYALKDITSSLNLNEDEIIDEIYPSDEFTILLTSTDRLLFCGDTSFANYEEIYDLEVSPIDITNSLGNNVTINQISVFTDGVNVLTNEGVFTLGLNTFSNNDLMSFKEIEYFSDKIDDIKQLRNNRVLMNDGTLYSWGKNEIGQVGNNTQIDVVEPVDISSFLPEVFILHDTITVSNRTVITPSDLDDNHTWFYDADFNDELDSITITKDLKLFSE